MAQRICSVPDCEKPYLAKGLCRGHYHTLRRTGTLDYTPKATPRVYGPRRSTIEDALLDRFDFSAGCWEWHGAKNADGYGTMSWKNEHHQAHRWVWLTVVGPIPEGLQLDHLCRNRACVNPDHLEPVTLQENLRRGERATGERNNNGRKTHCKRGHPFDESNTLQWVDGYRRCRTCRNESRRVA